MSKPYASFEIIYGSGKGSGDLPAEVRNKLGLKKGDLAFTETEQGVLIRVA